MEAVRLRYESLFPLRDILAHAKMQVFSGPGTSAFLKFSDFYASGKLIAFREKKLTVEDLQQRTVKAARASRATDRLFFSVNSVLPEMVGRPGI